MAGSEAGRRPPGGLGVLQDREGVDSVRTLQSQAPREGRLSRGEQPGGPSADVERVSGEHAGSAGGPEDREQMRPRARAAA